MNEQEYKNAVQLLLSQEGNNYLLGLYFLLEHKSLEHICDLIIGNVLEEKRKRVCFGNYTVQAYTHTDEVETRFHSKEFVYGNSMFVTPLPSNKPKYRKSFQRKEIHKHLIRIFDSLV